MTYPNPANRLFVHWHDSRITGKEAMTRYPDPKFFMRARPSMTLDECREYLQRNADEAARVVDMLRSNVSFKQKAPILHVCNKLHDFRISIDMHGGEQGKPYLWEE
jgi:hypothetical protein